MEPLRGIELSYVDGEDSAEFLAQSTGPTFGENKPIFSNCPNRNAPKEGVTELLARFLGNSQNWKFELARTPKGHQDSARGFNPWNRPYRTAPRGGARSICSRTYQERIKRV